MKRPHIYLKMLLAVGIITIAPFISTKGAGMAKTLPLSEKSIYEFTMMDVDGKEFSLESYRGKVLLLVNVASKCGFTPQYEGLEKIYQTYKDQGLVILGFPANNFLGQEPGTNEEIKTFCSLRYNVTFPLFSKISVKGKDKHPLYRFLTEKESNPQFSGEIKWNFNKFLISKQGKIIARYDSGVKPESETIRSAIENAIKATEQ